MEQTLKVLQYEFSNLVRSRWLLLVGLFFFLAAEASLRFGGDSAKAIVALMNITLLVVPLISLMFGIVYFYQSREFIELLLAQPVRRRSIFLGKLIGLVTAMSLVIVLGILIPFLVHASGMRGYWGNLSLVLGVTFAFVAIFVALAFWLATALEDRVKGFGSAILLWLYLSIVYDGFILAAIYAFREYPLENTLIVLATLNPIDLGRILILLQLDIAVLMGYTGAVFLRFFGSALGVIVSLLTLLLWIAVPTILGTRRFARKDF